MSQSNFKSDQTQRKCSICSLPLKNLPIYQSPSCGHLICLHCVKKMKTPDQCNQCVETRQIKEKEETDMDALKDRFAKLCANLSPNYTSISNCTDTQESMDSESSVRISTPLKKLAPELEQPLIKSETASPSTSTTSPTTYHDRFRNGRKRRNERYTDSCSSSRARRDSLDQDYFHLVSALDLSVKKPFDALATENPVISLDSTLVLQHNMESPLVDTINPENQNSPGYLEDIEEMETVNWKCITSDLIESDGPRRNLTNSSHSLQNAGSNVESRESSEVQRCKRSSF